MSLPGTIASSRIQRHIPGDRMDVEAPPDAVDVPAPADDQVPPVAQAPGVASSSLFQRTAFPSAPPAKAILFSKDGNIVQRMNPVYFQRNVSEISDFQNLVHLLEEHAGLPSIKYQKFVALAWQGREQAEALYTKLVQHGCSLIGINEYSPNECTAVLLRGNVRKRLALTGITLSRIFTLKNKSGTRLENYNCTVVEFLQAWMKVGIHIKVDFEIQPVVKITTKDLHDQWASLSHDDIEWEILSAEEKIKLKRPHTERDALIHAMGRSVLKYRVDKQSNISPFKYLADSALLIPRHSFINLGSVVCWTFDVGTGIPITCSLDEWLTKGYYRKYTVVAHGDADLGKTEVMKSLMADLALELQTTGDFNPYFIKIETVDAIRECVTSGLLRCSIPILLDEIKPDAMCGTRRGHSLEDLKHLCEVTTSTTVHARYRDICFDVDQPRAFTSNAGNPHEWHQGLPDQVKEVSNDTRKSYQPDIKAIFKRTCFAHIQHSLIPQGMRDAFEARRRGMPASSSGGQ